MQSAQELVRKQLSEIVKSKPDVISTDYKWLTETLKEQYLQNSTNQDEDCNKEINGLANCLFWGIADDIRESYSKTLDLSDVKNLLRRLVRDYGQQEDLARWCIDSWCNALNKSVDLSAVGTVPISSSIPTQKTNIPPDNSFSEETFMKYVSETLKTKELDLDTKLFLTVKGKQLGLSDEHIIQIFNISQKHVFDFKKRAEENRLREQKQIEDEKLREINKIKEDNFLKTQEERREKIRQKELEKEQIEERFRRREKAKQDKIEAEEKQALKSQSIAGKVVGYLALFYLVIFIIIVICIYIADTK